MEQDENIIARIKEMLGVATPNFSILEHQIDIKLQMEYFEYSKSHQAVLTPNELLLDEPKLYSNNVDFEDKKELLVGLASVDKPEAYRILERFATNAPEQIKGWAIMALQESRMLLETRMLDEQQVFISTGLGGKNGKLRYFVVALSNDEIPFTDTQQRLISSEFDFSLKRFNADIEEIRFASYYFSVIAVVPLSVPIRQPFKMAIDECNSLGRFIKSSFLITNVKLLTDSEIDEIVRESENPPDEE